MCEVKLVKPFESFMAGDYKVTALPALHDKRTGPVFYQIVPFALKEGFLTSYDGMTVIL